MLWTIFLIFHIKYTSSEGYEVRESIDGCVLASPNITYTRDGNYIDLPEEVRDAIEDDDSVHVGYMNTFRVFQYIGCRYIHKNNLPQRHLVKSDPGQCYSYCKTQYFAIHKTQCYCLGHTLYEASTENWCVKECAFPRNTACGGDALIPSYMYVSLYKHVETEETGTDDGHFCRAYNTITGTFQWGDCGFQLNGLCQSDTKDSFVDDYSTWIRYVGQCLHRDSYPASENDSRIGNPNQWVVWIGRIRSWVVVSSSESEKTDQHLNYKGYLKKVDDQFVLEFSNNQPTGQSKFLCLTGQTPEPSIEISSPSSSLTSSVSTASSSSTPQMIPIKLSSPHTTDSTKENNSGQQTEHSQQTVPAQQTCKGLIAVYVLVPVCLIVCTTVLSLFIISRRRAKTISETQYIDPTVTFKSTSTVNRASQNRAYERDFITRPKSATEAEYFLLEPSSRNYNEDNTSQLATLNRKETSVNEADYATTTADMHADDNIYSRLEEEGYDEYDHSNARQCGQNQQTKYDNTYNHLEKDSDHSDSYNTLNGDDASQKAIYNSGSVYDHAT